MIVALPIAMLSLLAWLSMFAAIILRRPWQKYVALGCAAFEVVGVAILVLLNAFAG